MKKNTFKEYQERKQTAREKTISTYLKAARATRVQYPHITALARVVAAHLSSEEGRSVSKTTLLRNWRYKSQLVGFIAGGGGVSEKSWTGAKIDAQSQLDDFKSTLQLTNLRRENERLKLYITSLERNSEKALSSTDAVAGDKESALRASFEAAQSKYALTCQALHSLLTHIDDFVSVDADGERFIDRAKLRHNVIVERRLASPFFEWLRAHRNILGDGT